MSLIYPTYGSAIFVHDEIIAISGGYAGVLNAGRLESIMVHIQNDDYYPDFVDKVTHLLYQINKGHCFNDGNKRTSIAIAVFFIQLNGLDSLVSNFIKSMENIAVHVADNRIDKDLLREVVDSLLNEDDYSEELKLKLVHVLE